MKKAVLALFLLTPLMAQSAEQKVLQRVQSMMRESGGRVTFSDLYNNPDLAPDEKAFMARLYEIFFQIPSYLKSEFQATGKAPTRREMADSFGITTPSVDLLLAVMQADPRVPLLFERNPETREIETLKMDVIEAFIARRGSGVKITQWEGQTVPTFDLEDFQGGKVGSGDLRGKNVLLYFWFTGCPPCVRIAPILARLDSEYESRNFRVIGLNADRVLELETTDEQRNSYLEKKGLRYTNLHVDQATRAAFGNVAVFPTLFFVKPDGTIYRYLINFQEQEVLEKIILEMVGASE